MLHKGFTLIELMIVVAIIGILAMFAMPAYQNYIKRTYVSEGLLLASEMKLSLLEFYMLNGKWPDDQFPPEKDIPQGAAVALIYYGGQGTIYIKYNYKVLIPYSEPTDQPPYGTGTIALTPIGGAKSYDGLGWAEYSLDSNVGSLQWVCSSINGSSSTGGLHATGEGVMLAKWLPSNCREQIIAFHKKP